MQRFRYSLTAASLACALLGYAPSSHAADPRADAQVRQEEGIKRYNAGDMNGALSAFTQAYAIYPSPKILWNLILTELELGRNLEAARNIHVYLVSTDPAATAQKKDAARQKLEDARKKLGSVKIEAPQGARLFIDGKPFPTAYAVDDVVELDGGGHTVAMETAAQRKERAVNVKVGEVTRVTFAESAPEPVAAPPPVIAPVAPPPPEPPPEKSGGLACPKSGACLATTIGLAAIGIAGGVGAVIFNSSADSAKKDADDLHGSNGSCTTGLGDCNGRLQTLKDDHSSRLTLSRISLGVGAASLVGAGVLFFVWPSKSNKEPSARITPLISPNTAGMGLTGRF
ncbi:hypothetical protein LZC95_32590 [Pendulispora brunnea]|uniref:PEGA domain-containing protein n=1 Tax=Pendulispora brunnea TaxID=2905690 RepID=A0ABZ2JXV7_9BACT